MQRDTPIHCCVHCGAPVRDIELIEQHPEKYTDRHVLVPLEPGVMEQRYFCSELCHDCYDACDIEEGEYSEYDALY